MEAPATDAQPQAFERRKQRRADRLYEVAETVSSSRSQQIERDLQRDQAIDQVEQVINNLRDIRHAALHYMRIGASIAYYQFCRDGADQAPARKGEARVRLQRHLY